jgi:hypothetical protein
MRHRTGAGIDRSMSELVTDLEGASTREPLHARMFEIIVAILLGAGALGGAWAGYQANQWGATAVENFGKSSTTSTRASTLYNRGVAVANRDSNLDIQAKQLVLSAVTTEDPVAKERDMTVAKYLYVRQMSQEGYQALGYPMEFRVEDDEKASQIPDDVLIKGLDAELDDRYLTRVLGEGEAKFVEADKIFSEGQIVSARSTAFGLVAVMFTVTLFLAGIALTLKSNLRWAFATIGYGSLIAASVKLFGLPWYG